MYANHVFIQGKLISDQTSVIAILSIEVVPHTYLGNMDLNEQKYNINSVLHLCRVIPNNILIETLFIHGFHKEEGGMDFALLLRHVSPATFDRFL